MDDRAQPPVEKAGFPPNQGEKSFAGRQEPSHDDGDGLMDRDEQQRGLTLALADVSDGHAKPQVVDHRQARVRRSFTIGEGSVPPEARNQSLFDTIRGTDISGRDSDVAAQHNDDVLPKNNVE